MREPTVTKGWSLEKARAEWVRQLRAYCPTRRPLRVFWDVSSLPEGALASCVLRDRIFVIRICPAASRTELAERLVHEWAHAVCWFDKHPPNQDHPRCWGIAYARCYQAVMDL